MAFKIDLHCHSFFSGDGVSSPEDLIASARRKGLDGFALTDNNTSDGCRYLLDKGLMGGDGRGRGGGVWFSHCPRRRGDDAGGASALPWAGAPVPERDARRRSLPDGP